MNIPNQLDVAKLVSYTRQRTYDSIPQNSIMVHYGFLNRPLRLR